MRILKATLEFFILAYVVFTVLLLSGAIDENTIITINNSSQQPLQLYKAIVAIGGVLLLAKMLANRVHVADLTYAQHQAQLKINELKADLYEKRQEFRSNSYRPHAQEHRVELLKQA